MAEAGAGVSPRLVPPTHPSEQEAERISRAVIAPDAGRWPANTRVTQRSRRGVAQRKPAPPKSQAKSPDKPQGKDIVFIMGVDKNPRKNPFYREAVKYFKATQPGATLVNDNNHRSLESVFDYLASACRICISSRTRTKTAHCRSSCVMETRIKTRTCSMAT
jgi:hypothetical protein